MTLSMNKSGWCLIVTGVHVSTPTARDTCQLDSSVPVRSTEANHTVSLQTDTLLVLTVESMLSTTHAAMKP